MSKISEKKAITNFIKCVSEENYSDAHKYLQLAVESKLKKRIALAQKQKLF